MLTSIKIENFRGIRNCDVSNLGRVNVFIGRNNSGKSSILDALCLAKIVFNDRLFDEPVLHLLLRRKGIERNTYTLRSFWHNYDIKNHILIGLGFGENIHFNFEIRWSSDSNLYAYLEETSHMLPPHVNGKYILRETRFLTGGFSDRSGQSIDVIDEKYPKFSRFMHELVLIDDYLARKLERFEITVFSRILEPRLDKKVAQFLNEIYSINAEGLSYIPISPNIKERFVLAVATSTESIRIDDLGDGAKYASVILSLSLLLENSSLLIEEIESHQHTGAIAKLLPSLIKISREKNIQLFMTTHSLEVVQALSNLSKEFDIQFFHIQRDEQGNVTARQLPSIDMKVLLDLGIDVRNLDTYKKFIVVEGDADIVFIESLAGKYSRSIREIGYLVKAGGRENIKLVSASLLSAEKDILVMRDYDNKAKDDLLKSLADAIKNRNYEIEIQQNDELKIREGVTVTLLPLGLPNDDTLKEAGITWHEMEDYCLKLVEEDPSLKEWASISSLKEFATQIKEAGIEGANKSSTLLTELAVIKRISKEEVIKSIIRNADQKYLEKTIPENLKRIITSGI